jgi:hypothetical protein
MVVQLDSSDIGILLCSFPATLHRHCHPAPPLSPRFPHLGEILRVNFPTLPGVPAWWLRFDDHGCDPRVDVLS